MESSNEDKIDVLATDHAPHTLEEKQNPYANSLQVAHWFNMPFLLS